MTRTINFAQYSSIKIGPVIDVQIVNEENYQSHQDGIIIGSCSNILMSSKPPKLLLLDKKYDFIVIKDNKLHIGAATPNGKIVSFCKKNDITNFEFLAHLPGKLGGIIKMNAGLKETEIFNYIHSVLIGNNTVLKENIIYGYRSTNINKIIFSAIFNIEYGYSKEKQNYFSTLRNNQPTLASAGSCFKNPIGDYAGRLIEEIGYKGKRIGNMEFSSVHANFLVNNREDNNRNDFNDAKKLILEVKEMILQKYNITLEEEIIILETQHDTCINS